MSEQPASIETTALEAQEGVHPLSAAQALLRAVLESEQVARRIVVSNTGPFAELDRAAAAPGLRAILDRHELEVLAVEGARATVRAAARSMRGGDRTIAMLGNEELERALPEITVLLERPGAGEARSPAPVLVIEDDPLGAPAACPRMVGVRLGMAVLESARVSSIGPDLDAALRLARAERAPVMLVVHRAILRSGETVAVGPHRAGGPLDDPVLRRRLRRRPRPIEGEDVLRLARRLEITRARAMPSPGERVPLGLVTVGPADDVLAHAIGRLRLHGRVPVLHLGLLHPVDAATIGRLLDRCDSVVVLEPRPGSIGGLLLEEAESRRPLASHVASIWTRAVPVSLGATTGRPLPGGPLHPTELRAAIGHLLRELRPGGDAPADELDPRSGAAASSDGPADAPVDALVDSGAGPPALTEAPSLGAVRGRRRDARSVPAGARAIADRLVEELDRWLHERSVDLEPGERRILCVDGRGPDVERRVPVPLDRFDRAMILEEGPWSIARIVAGGGPAIVVVMDLPRLDGRNLERIIRAALPGEALERAEILRRSLGDPGSIRAALRAAAIDDRVHVLLLEDDDPPQFDRMAVRREHAEVDRLGYQPVRVLTWPAERACELRAERRREEATLLPDGRGAPSFEPRTSTGRVSGSMGWRPSLRIRLLHVRIRVTRVRPPVLLEPIRGLHHLPRPTPVHGDRTVWRVHLAGMRGDGPGVAGRVLLEAGRRMGFAVRWRHEDDPEDAWAQVLFASPGRVEGQTDRTVAIPDGGADLLLGLDVAGARRAVSPEGRLRVADPARTVAVVDEPEGSAAHARVDERCRADAGLRADASALCRQVFRTDRLADVCLLGVAFQLGQVPVTAEVLEESLEHVERSGFARLREAFRLGRRLALDGNLAARLQDETREPVDRTARRLTLLVARSGGPGRRGAEALGRVIRSTLRAMPGLAETEAGRAARRDLVHGLYAAWIWGGPEHARRLADLVVPIYQRDRGETGRARTRDAILPIAESMLIRDPLHVASMLVSPEARRAVRRHLNIKLARGDRVEQRIRLRIELRGFGRRVRSTFATGEWIVRLLAGLRHVVPASIRGTRRERAIRELVRAFAIRAAQVPDERSEEVSAAMYRLHRLADRGQLRSVSVEELQVVLGPIMQDAVVDERAEGLDDEAADPGLDEDGD